VPGLSPIPELWAIDEMALRLSKGLGRSPESWLAMQDNYDLWHARQNIDVNDIEPIPISG